MFMALCTKFVRLNNLRGIYRSIMTSPFNLAKAQEDLEKNPYFEKYAAKINSLRSADPEAFEQKIKEVEEQKQKYEEKLKPPKLQSDHKIEKPKEKRGYKDKTLDSIMNVDLLKGKSVIEIEAIWKEYYRNKDDVIYASMTKDVFNKFMKKCKDFPTFLLPLPRGAGYEFFMSQQQENSIHLASVAQYKLHKENCPECLCLTYFPDLPQDIVLMLGEYDNQSLSGQEASCLVNILQFFYSSDSQFELVKSFNRNPQTFDHNTLIAAMTNLSLNQ